MSEASGNLTRRRAGKGVVMLLGGTIAGSQRQVNRTGD